ncbi:MAG TPA: mechanosensitive ion channel family protein [Bdellovibrionales bacterium]|nr:mechanosensitive ion channel family protein [Bdellovibrionales bacterium]
MSDWIHQLGQIITKEQIFNTMWAIVLVMLGMFVAKKSENAVAKLSKLDTQQRIMFSRFTKYGILTLAFAAALNQLGFDLKVILGAAGVLTVAIGFAAQTSASNLISGLFLMVERPFVVGDAIKVADITGTVVSIDLLSSKIKTFDNLMVRIPNETLVKSNIINYTYFPVRRADITVGVSYSADLKRVEEILREVARSHPFCLTEPEPVFAINGFGDSAINVQIFVYTITENLQTMKNDLHMEIKRRFIEEHIDIPFPVRTLIMQQPTVQA